MRITVLKQNIKDDVSFKSGLTKVLNDFASISFPVDISIKTTNKVFSTATFFNQTIGQGNCVVPEQILSQVDGSEDVAFLFFSNQNMNPKPLNPLQTPIKKGSATVCQMCEEWYNDYDYVLEEFFLHEICHALYFLLGQVQNDATHAYPQAFSQKSRREYYLYLIQSLIPAWNQYKMSEVILQRNTDTGFETLGEIAFNGFSAKTLERPWKNNQKDISCIPKGQYTCKWTRSFRFPLGSYEVQNVPNRSGIRFHLGNYFFDVDGCILLGDSFSDINKDGKVDVLNSKITISKFESFMNRQDFNLKII